jgi:hypothetical protein
MRHSIIKIIAAAAVGVLVLATVAAAAVPMARHLW